MAEFSFNLQDVVRPNIWELTPYRCARDVREAAFMMEALMNLTCDVTC